MTDITTHDQDVLRMIREIEQDPRLAEASHVLRQAFAEREEAVYLLRRAREHLDRARRLHNEIVFYLFVSVALLCTAMFWELAQ